MATEILRPNAAGDLTQIPGQSPGSGAHWDKVDEVSPDEMATMVLSMLYVAKTDIYHLPAHSVGSGTINHVKVYARCATANAVGIGYVALKCGATLQHRGIVGVTTSWATFSYQWDLNPDDDEAFDWDDIDDMQIGVQITNFTSVAIYCTQVYVEIDYTLEAEEQYILPSSITSAEAFGISKLNLKVAPSAISSLEAFGAAKLNLKIVTDAISSLEAFGTPKLNLGIIVSSITSSEVFGTAKIVLKITMDSIVSLEAFGIPKINQRIKAVAITSIEAFGVAKINQRITAMAITSAEAFGTASVFLAAYFLAQTRRRVKIKHLKVRDDLHRLEGVVAHDLGALLARYTIGKPKVKHDLGELREHELGKPRDGYSLGESKDKYGLGKREEER